MAIFKYTVANKEGKKLSGTVEAPDENVARNELNNLGFSILLLQETNEKPVSNPNFTKFLFEALDKNSKSIKGTIPANSEEEAFTKLQTQYNVIVTALWKEGSTEEQIQEAKKLGNQKIQSQLKPEQIQEIENSKIKSIEDQKKEQFTRTKIEFILQSVNQLLTKFDQEFTPSQKTEINKKIAKILRIKNSTNLDYILSSAEDLLTFIKEQQQEISITGHEEKKFELKLETKKLLQELHKTQKPKTLSEDIIEKIQKWEQKHQTNQDQELKTGLIASLLLSIKKLFETPLEIQTINDQIKVYNSQLWDLLKLYFKEPTPQYKERVKSSLKTVWSARKEAKKNLAIVKKQLKEKKETLKIDSNLSNAFLEESNSLTGWLLFFYTSYYILALYITNKDFGLSTIPQGFQIYESQIFKYILVILFLLHSCISLKLNFFKKNILASIILPILFIFSSSIVILNF